MRKPHAPSSGGKLPEDVTSPEKVKYSIVKKGGGKRSFIVHDQLGKLNAQDKKIIRNHETDPFV